MKATSEQIHHILTLFMDCEMTLRKRDAWMIQNGFPVDLRQLTDEQARDTIVKLLDLRAHNDAHNCITELDDIPL